MMVPYLMLVLHLALLRYLTVVRRLMLVSPLMLAPHLTLLRYLTVLRHSTLVDCLMGLAHLKLLCYSMPVPCSILTNRLEMMSRSVMGSHPRKGSRLMGGPH